MLIGIILWVPVGIAVGICIGFLTNFTLGYLGGLIVVLSLCYMCANWYLGRIVKVWKVSESKLMKSMPNPDYFNYGSGGGISIDIASKRICYVDATNSKKPKDGYVFDLSKIIGLEWYEPGRTEFYSSGGLANGMQTDMNNDREKQRQAMATGLTLQLDDIHNPKLFLRMDYAEAERWGFLLQKFMKGTLAEQSQPVFYPTLPCQ